MRFLVDANLPRSTIALFGRYNHSAEHVRVLGLGMATDSQVASHARSTGAVLVTRDMDFSDVRRYPPADYPGIIVIRLSEDAVAQDILDLLERFLKQTNLVIQLPGHLIVLEEGRVRFRPALP